MPYPTCQPRAGQGRSFVLQGLTGSKVIDPARGQPGNSAVPPMPKLQNSGLQSYIGAQVPAQNTSIPAEYTEPLMQYTTTNGYPEAPMPVAGGHPGILDPPIHPASRLVPLDMAHNVDVRSFGYTTLPGVSMTALPGPFIPHSSMGDGSDGMHARARNTLGHDANFGREDPERFPYNGSFPRANTDVSQGPSQMQPLPIAAHTFYHRHAYPSTHPLPSNVGNLLVSGGGLQVSSSHSPSASSRQICTTSGRSGLTHQATQALESIQWIESITTPRSHEDAILNSRNPSIPPSSNVYKEVVDAALRCRYHHRVAQTLSSRPGPRHPSFNDWLVSRPDRPMDEAEPLDWPPIEEVMQFMTESVSPHGISMFSQIGVVLVFSRDWSNVNSQLNISKTDILQMHLATQLESTSCNGILGRQTSGVTQIAGSSATLETPALIVESSLRGCETDAGQDPYRVPKIATGNANSIKDSLLMPPPRTLPRRSTRVAHEAKLGQQPWTCPRTSMHAKSIRYQNPNASDQDALTKALRFDRDIRNYPIPELPELHRNECPSKIDYGHLTAYGSVEAIASYPPTFQASLLRTMQNMKIYDFRRTQSHDLVFVYGSLMISCLEHDIFNGRVSPFTTKEVSQCMVAASVGGFKLYRVRGSHEPVALGTGKDKDVIHGILIFNLSKEECCNLDRYAGWGYVRSPAKFCVKLKSGHTNGYARIYCAPNDRFLDYRSGGGIVFDEPWTVEDFWKKGQSCIQWREQNGRNHGANSGVQVQHNVQRLSYPGYNHQDQPSARLKQGGMGQSLGYLDHPVTNQMLSSFEPPALIWGNPQIGPAQIMSNVGQGGSVQQWEEAGQNGNDQTISNAQQVGSIHIWEGSDQNGINPTTSNVEPASSIQNWEGYIQNGDHQTMRSVEQIGSIQDYAGPSYNGNDQTMINVEQVGSVQNWEEPSQNGNDQTMSNGEPVASNQTWEGSGENGNDQTLNGLLDVDFERYPHIDLDPNSLDAFNFDLS